MGLASEKIKESTGKVIRRAKAMDLLKIIPGVIICLSIMFASILITNWLGKLLIDLGMLPIGSSSPISGIFVSVIIGLLVRNTVGLHAVFNSGVKFSMKFFLKCGIILLGLRLSIIDVVKLGSWGIPIVIICISTGLLITMYITKKLNQSPRLGILVASGTGICGVTAIMATAPVVKATDDEISYAVANITLFGLLGMFFYPYLAFYLFDNDPIRVGLFLGTAIHDTAQVTGAALIYNQTFDMEKVVLVATITKLTRNFFIIAVVPLLSYFYLRNENKNMGSDKQAILRWYQLIPYFVIGFLVMSIVRSIGDAGIEGNQLAFGVISLEYWETFHIFTSNLGSKYLLGIAMAAIGLSTSFSIFKKFGMKPLYIGITAALSVGLVSICLVYLLGGLISF